MLTDDELNTELWVIARPKTMQALSQIQSNQLKGNWFFPSYKDEPSEIIAQAIREAIDDARKLLA